MLRYAALLLILLSANPLWAQEIYGLEFASKNISQEDRTSLDLFPAKPLPVKNSFRLSFDVSFLPFFKSNFGYIVRLLDDKQQNIDLIYNMHTRAFDLVTGNCFSGISFKINSNSLYHRWNNIVLDFNLLQHSVSVTVNNRLIGTVTNPVINCREVDISFGVNSRKGRKTFDLPPMRLKDIQVFKQGNLKHHWPLNELQGNYAHDVIARQTAAVKNPVWIQPASKQWRMEDSVVIKGQAAVTLDQSNEIVFVTSTDSIYQFSPFHHKITATALQTAHNMPPGIRAFYEPGQQQLLHIFPDQQLASTYDTSNKSWSRSFSQGAVTTYWHASMFYSPFDSAIYTLGGYGDFNYKNEVQRFSPRSGQWEKIGTAGDFFTPRYLSATGTNKAGDSAFIIGGYGSLTGDQLLNPHALYDLLVFDVKRRTFKKIYQLPEPEETFVFANNLVINTDKEEYYALTFPNDRMKSSLQLIRGSLRHPVYKKVAASIPYRFYDIQSSAYLFYCPQNDKLVAVTLFTDTKTAGTTVKIYTILFSPYGLAVPVSMPLLPPYIIRLIWCISIGFGLFLVFTTISWFRNRRSAAAIPVPAPVPPEPKEERAADSPAKGTPAIATAINLFGPFTVLDAEGNDISRSFTPLLKELFLLLYLHTEMGKGGISSERINELLWPGRAAKDAKNNRSVNFVKLKSLLDRVGNYSLCKENDRWILQLDPETIPTDLKNFLECNDPIRMAAILNKGGFLPETEYEWLDKFKATIASDSIQALLQQLEKSASLPDDIVSICNAVLLSDPLCEEAIYYKCKALINMKQHASAKKIYTDFTKAYQNLYGESFDKPYSEMIDQAIAVP
ncbi:Two-component response regulator, SAPR family, consists of REC, wHTH and BTAD domains [Chitinophaga terrae (ex Kim and Jung 2007)]|uniref:Two-component response regulator, SAPR family, consists of REC, wHTH and BTAD domains n=1 Tax=Chitinophaga terrae (ex Kim and Jung 2007) TaxID=408074 RepID=A0A1H3XEH6_9BACT|nr:hypothetical protein [Chitinophaga terrae (ex Kim and Jung 2007)]GEP89801.1 hypothetical protein CTE07_14460 [Chitinophaga terrae (ex Kim and Jung 2007)]SDZ97022.1 Two-component response regulator, SAPR family, consists of REC, wHTH and BTAD domains [Chitinophaga terrae (ex Kim and Jung 2007)]